MLHVHTHASHTMESQLPGNSSRRVVFSNTTDNSWVVTLLFFSNKNKYLKTRFSKWETEKNTRWQKPENQHSFPSGIFESTDNICPHKESPVCRPSIILNISVFNCNTAIPSWSYNEKLKLRARSGNKFKCHQLNTIQQKSKWKSLLLKKK